MSRRAVLTLVSFLIGAGAALAQPLAAYWNSLPGQETEIAEATRRVDQFVVDHQGQPEARHLARVFRKFQQSFLGRYEAYADFSSMFTNKTYDCLTATTLLSHILDRLGYRAEIVETTYHIFVKVSTPEGPVLLETTDRVGGFVNDEKLIADRIAGYQKDDMVFAGRDSYRYSRLVYRTVTSSDLVGLLLYNQSVKAYNSRNWLGSAKYLEASFARYPSERCHEMAAILLRTLHEHPEVAPDTRRACLEHLLPVIARPSGNVAASESIPVSFR
ncbi:MAG: hypothetical protein JNN04_06685 [Cyclobacteriaceae bacterium]|nr:hypothetical protein [Cyclobacteriaceae bacterium]